MHPLLESLYQVADSLGNLLLSIGGTLVPLLPLAIWVAFWTFAVNWVKLRSVLLSGGWLGLLLIGLLAVLVWGTVAPPPSGQHHFLGLTLGNFVGKTVLITTLVCIMFLCGSVQLSGICGSWCHFEEPAVDEHAAHAHGDAHGHAAGHH